MFQTDGFRSRSHALSSICVLVACTFAFVVLTGSPASLRAQEKLDPAQQKTMAQCLVTCKKGDASCQNACTGKTASPAYLKAAGSCVRACADALAVPGQNQSQVDDLGHCVSACN